MAAYAIGDVQGCYNSLCRLLDKLKFDDSADELWLAGDLVNRGPDSARVIRLARELGRVRAVLGNHDLHLLAVSEGFRKTKRTDTFSDILSADDREALLSWLRNQPLLHFDKERRTVLVHAGLLPGWSLNQARSFAGDISALLVDNSTYPVLLERMYGNEPAVWSENMDKFDEARWAINAFTRMRFCAKSGKMDFKQVGAPGTQPEKLYPWFKLRQATDYRVIFGHWSLHGAGAFDGVVALDSGCVYGGRLSAINIDELPPRLIQVSCTDKL
jgi:bis(5'-nucleosyl)-tetraphosphatase (symmetrical)